MSLKMTNLKTVLCFIACIISVPQEGTDLLPEFVFQRQIYNKTLYIWVETETSTQRVSLGWILPPEVYCRYLGLVFLVKTWSLLSQLLFVPPCPRQLNFDFVSVLKSSLVYSPWGYSSVVALYTQGPGFHHHSALPETSPIVLQPVCLLFFFKTQRWTRFAWLPWRS